MTKLGEALRSNDNNDVTFAATFSGDVNNQGIGRQSFNVTTPCGLGADGVEAPLRGFSVQGDSIFGFDFNFSNPSLYDGQVVTHAGVADALESTVDMIANRGAISPVESQAFDALIETIREANRDSRYVTKEVDDIESQLRRVPGNESLVIRR
ncbi:MAG: hypothetical protein J0M34_02540 [Alphaproteobacteria bacterium]|nr:hypothetical protein [Alphaproteobacteria bacterium]